VWETGVEHTGLWWRNLSERDHFEYQNVDGRIILRWIFRKWDRCTDWIDLDPDGDGWCALVNAVMNLKVP